MGMDHFLTEVKTFKLATAPQPKRKSRISIAERYIWPTQVTPVMVIPQKDEFKDKLHCSLPSLNPILQPVGMKARTEVENQPTPTFAEITGSALAFSIYSR